MKRINFWHSVAIYSLLLLLAVPLSIALLDIRFGFTLRTVMLGSAVLGMVSGVLGSFAVLRQQSLLGDTLSHAALPGVVIAYLIAGRDLGWLLLGAGIAGWLGVMLVTAVLRTTRIKQDAALGITLATFFGFGIALLGYIQRQEDASKAGLDKFIFGQAAAMSPDDVLLLSMITAVLIGLVVIFWKEFKMISFDREFGSTNGYPVRWLDMLLSTLTVIAIVIGLRLAGVILMVGLLIAPGVAARQWTHDLSRMVILAGLFGSSAGVAGAVISATETGLPTGPLIIVSISMIVFASLLFATERGLIWTWYQQRLDQRRFAAENILNDIYRLAQRHHQLAYSVPEGMLISVRGQVARAGIRELAGQGFIQSAEPGKWQLTPQGIQAAMKDYRNRKLWELYRMNQDVLNETALTEDTHRPIEEALSVEAVRQLETMLEEVSA